MDLKGYVSVTGQSGLFKILSQAKNGLIVESLIDQKRMPVYANQKVLSLEDISIFCVDGDRPLKEVFGLIYAKTDGKETLDSKITSVEDLAAYILEILPEFDKPRVYNSDLKKIFSWFNLLLPTGSLAPSVEEETKEGEAPAEAKPTDKTKKVAAAPKAKTVEKVAKTAKAAPKVAKSIGVRKTG